MRGHETAIATGLLSATPEVDAFVTRFHDALIASGRYPAVALHPQTFQSRMKTISTAVYGHPPRPEYVHAGYSQNQIDALRARGILVRPGTTLTVAPLFKALRDVMPVPQDADAAVLDRQLLNAVIASRVLAGEATISQILRDYSANVAGDDRAIPVDALNEALNGDFVDMYHWVDTNLATFSGSHETRTRSYDHAWQPPHHQMYPRFPARATGGTTVPDDLSAMIRALADRTGQTPVRWSKAPEWEDRKAAVVAWVEVHGGSPLDFLLPAHLAALFVGTQGPDRNLWVAPWLHQRVLAEALGRLPALPASEPVYFGMFVPDVPVAAIPAAAREFETAVRSPEAALAELDTREAGPGMRRVVVQVNGSPARDVSFAAVRPGLRQVMFPWATDLVVTSREWRTDGDGQRYEFVVATGRTADPRRTPGAPAGQHIANSESIAPASSAVTVSPFQDDDVIESADPAAADWEPAPEESRQGPAWDPAVLKRARSVLRELKLDPEMATPELVASLHDQLPGVRQRRIAYDRGEDIAYLIAGRDRPRLRGGAPSAQYSAQQASAALASQPGPSSLPSAVAGQPRQARPLFPSLYFGTDANRDYWLRLARGYETAVCRVLRQRVLYRQAAQATLAALAEQVIPMVPPGEAARVFFPGDGRPLDQLTAQLDALLEWDEDKAPELEAVMAAVAAGTRFYADLHGLTVPPVDPDLTRTLSELGHPVPATPDGERAALIRYVEELLLVHRRIGVVSRGHLYGAWDGADANAVAFRGAVFAMFAGRLSLAELFGAAQRAGVVDTDMAVPPRWMEPDFRDSVVVQADVAELHGLVPYLLSPESIDPALRRFPHEKRYAQMAADLLELDFDGSGDGPVVNDLIDDLDSGTVTFWPDKRNLDRWRQRRETFIAWLREHRHHYQGAAVGHLIALYLLGGPDATLTLLGLDAAPHAARKSVLRGRILGWLERLVQGADEAELPLVMRRNAEVAELAAHPALGTPQHLASLADDLASDQLMAELAEHAEMQRRALLTLPETGGPVWWGESVPGPSHGSVQPGVFARPALSRVMLDGRAAVRDAFEAVDRSGSGVPVVYWVEQPSRARAFGPFAQRPGDHAAYPDDVEFRPLKPQWVWDVQWQRWYLRIPLEQVDRTDGPVWRADPVVRLVSTDSGIPFAYSAINSSQWPEFSWHMVHLPGVMDYMVRSKDGSFGTLPTPPVASGFDSVGRPKAVVIETHGLSNDVMAAYSREGLAYGSGTVAARLADRMTRLTGRDPVTQDVLLVVCYAAQGARSSGQAAANRGRGGRVIAGNAVVVTGATSGRSVPLVYVQGEKGGPDPQWLQFGKQPVPVAAELWSALPFAGRRPGHRRWFGNGNRSWQDIAEQYEKFLGAALAANPGLAGLASGLAAALRSAGRPVIVQGESTLVNVMNAIDHATRDDRVYLVAGDGAERRAYLEERGLLVRTGEQRSMAALFAAQRAVVFDRQPDTTAADDHRGLLGSRHRLAAVHRHRHSRRRPRGLRTQRRRRQPRHRPGGTARRPARGCRGPLRLGAQDPGAIHRQLGGPPETVRRAVAARPPPDAPPRVRLDRLAAVHPDGHPRPGHRRLRHRHRRPSGRQHGGSERRPAR
ncbi:hypothetical protein SGRIM119S_03411 [Streptomyces griseorubiginosus]